MQIIKTIRFGREGWELRNDKLSLFLMSGGGHIAGLQLEERLPVNPYWIPDWKSIDPSAYRPQDAKRYGVKLLAGIAGHNLCLGMFGDPSSDEQKAGLGCHGEAPVARWRVLSRKVTTRRLVFQYGCILKIAQMRFTRTITLEAGSSIVRIRECVENLSRRDTPFTMCQHVTFGPPFVEPQVAIFDVPATKGHSFPGPFGKPQRLKQDAPFNWPYGSGINGKIDLRFVGRAPYGDYTANLINPKQEHGWFSVINPKIGMLVAYVWQRADFPWLGIWEENHARKTSPWNGKSLTRGMEFSNSPFPEGLRNAVERGRFQGQPTYRWLPALGRVRYDYSILACPVEADCKGVAAITPNGKTYGIDLIV